MRRPAVSNAHVTPDISAQKTEGRWRDRQNERSRAWKSPQITRRSGFVERRRSEHESTSSRTASIERRFTDGHGVDHGNSAWPALALHDHSRSHGQQRRVAERGWRRSCVFAGRMRFDLDIDSVFLANGAVPVRRFAVSVNTRSASPIGRSLNRRKLVVVGNGMAGARVVEEILKRDPDQFDITMFGAEPYGNYNRILLSNVLNGSQSPTEIFMNPLSWYRENNVRLHAGVKAERIDRERRVVVGRALKKDALAYSAEAAVQPETAEIEEPYDHVIIATGSRPFVPPMEGFSGAGAFLFRTIDDCARIADYARNSRRAAVIGGGLLGLEAARGLLTHGVEVTVLEANPLLMSVQLDPEAGDLLRKTIEGMGIRVMCNTITTKIARTEGRITHLQFKDGTTIETDMVVVSAGIRPITEIASASGLTVNRGIVCDDQMRTSDAEIFGVGECIEHRGQLYGLVDPIWEQANVLADVITGVKPDSAYHGSKLGTKLKVMGVELASMGITKPADADDEVVVYREPARGLYKKLILRGDKIAGAILLGDIEAAGTLMQMFFAGIKAPSRRADLLFGSPKGVGLLKASDLPDNAQICNCNGVSKCRIVDAIQEQNCTTVTKVG